MGNRPKYSYKGEKGVDLASWNGKSWLLTKAMKNQETGEWEKSNWFMSWDLQTVIDLCQKALAETGQASRAPVVKSKAPAQQTMSWKPKIVPQPGKTGFEEYPDAPNPENSEAPPEDDDEDNIPF